MRLTRRGWVVLGAVLGAVASGGLFGARALDAIAVPGAVALVAAAIQLLRVDPPDVERELPEVAHRGDAVRVRLRIDVASPFGARVLDHLDFGLVSEDNDRETTVSSGVVRYRIECAERGRKRVGPTRIEARDVLGLCSRPFRLDNAEELMVRPRIYPLVGPRRRELLSVRGGERRDRQEFEHLRDYDRGDALRDVHWKSSAKQPDDDLIVKEFTADDEHRAVEVGAEATPGAADAMADAAASVVVDLLDARFRVGLVTTDATVEPSADRHHRDVLLDHLAEVGGGPISPRERSRADVLIHATNRDVRVTIGSQRVSFDDLARTTCDEGADADEWVEAAAS